MPVGLVPAVPLAMPPASTAVAVSAKATGAALPSLAPVMANAMSADRPVRVPSETRTEPKESVATAPPARAWVSGSLLSRV